MLRLEEAALPKAQINKLVILDRDDTIVKNETGKFEVINPEIIIPIIEAISQADNSRLAIASKGALEVNVDPAMIALKQEGAAFARLPFYAQYGVTTLANSMISVEGIEFDEPDEIKKANHSYVAAEAQIPATNREKTNGIPLNNGAWVIQNGTGKRTDGRQITLTPNTVWTVKLGETLIKIRAKEFFDNFYEYYLGDCKIVAIFLALDANKLKIKLSDNLRNLGFVGIEAPAEYQEIAQNDVVFLDDRPHNCAYVRAAGFTAIDADTPSSEAHHRKPVQNTYLRHLIKTLPPNVYDLYQKRSEARYWNVDQQVLLNRAQKASGEQNYIAAMILFKIAYLRTENEIDKKKILEGAIAATHAKTSTKLEQPQDNSRLELYLQRCREEGGFNIELKLLEFTFEILRATTKPLTNNLFYYFASPSYSADSINRFKALVVSALQLKSNVSLENQQKCDEFINKIVDYAKHSTSLRLEVAAAIESFNKAEFIVAPKIL